jgi:hypothetical protein
VLRRTQQETGRPGRLGRASPFTTNVQKPRLLREELTHERPQLLGCERLAEDRHVTGQFGLDSRGGPVDVGDVEDRQVRQTGAEFVDELEPGMPRTLVLLITRPTSSTAKTSSVAASPS